MITHATVINPGTSSVQADQTVVIANDRITSVTDAEKLQPPKNARVIDATGQYLIPGLWDMHVHSAFGDWFPGGRDIILPLFIAESLRLIAETARRVNLRACILLCSRKFGPPPGWAVRWIVILAPMMGRIFYCSVWNNC